MKQLQISSTILIKVFNNFIKLICLRLSVILFILSCNQNNDGDIKKNTIADKDSLLENNTDLIDPEHPYSIYNNTPLQKERMKYRKMAYEALIHGDEKLYAETSAWHRLHYFEEFVRFSFEMAYKYDSGNAYSDIVEYYSQWSSFNGKDTLFVNFLLYNAAKAKELGQEHILMEIDGRRIPLSEIKSSNYYLEKMKTRSRGFVIRAK